MQTPNLWVNAAVLLLLILPGPAQAQPATDQLAGDDICMECHEQIYEDFSKSIHGVAKVPRTPAAEHADFICESCHGPGALHAEEGESGNIRSLSRDSASPSDQKNAVCLQCHTGGKTAMWQGSTHETRSVACADCHSVHQARPDYLAKETQLQLCAACHPQIRPRLMRFSHHPIPEGQMTCSDCHNTHGTIADKLVDAQTINQKCFQCHAKIRGPYIWQHPPAIEDCLTCHTPHGASFQFLLNGRPPLLCQRCHSNVDHSGLLQARNSAQAGQSVYRSLGNLGFYRACLNCHSAVHGSNHPSGKSLLR